MARPLPTVGKQTGDRRQLQSLRHFIVYKTEDPIGKEHNHCADSSKQRGKERWALK